MKSSPLQPAAVSRSSPSARLRAWFGRLIPRLSFAEPLETQFREWYSSRVRWRMRSTMWLAM
ncbi:MAG TPA: hypothetical protein VNA21_00380, partial [Steroidobacteraceae bacterium]|nr:hypothetical protein [Steroidobacteraceae bacterium]